MSEGGGICLAKLPSIHLHLILESEKEPFMMKRAGQLFDVLLAILVINKIFTMACTPDAGQNPVKSEPAGAVEGAVTEGSSSHTESRGNPSLPAIPLEPAKNQ